MGQDTEHSDMARTQPVTPRALETLIRLATAHAKARLSRAVESEDADAAIEMVSYAYFKKVMEKKKKKAADESEDDEEVTEPRKRKRSKDGSKKAKKPRKQPGEDGYDAYDISQSEEEMEEEPPQNLTPAEVRRSMEKLDETPASTQKEISAPRLTAFKSTLTKLFKEERSQTAALGRLKEFLKTEHPDEPFTNDEVDAAITKMTDANQIMVADEMLFLI